jgi:nitrile hydratase accessory protein
VSDNLELPLPITGKAAPPRQNGQLLFEAPWQSRVFGIAVSLAEQGAFEWHEFQSQLIAAIDHWENQPIEERGEWDYYHCWQQALEALLHERQLVACEALTTRVHQFADRPHGHDH